MPQNGDLLLKFEEAKECDVTIRRKVDRLQQINQYYQAGREEEDSTILPHILKAYKHAKSEIRPGENPIRSIIRFSFAMTNSILSQLDEEPVC